MDTMYIVEQIGGLVVFLGLCGGVYYLIRKGKLDR